MSAGGRFGLGDAGQTPNTQIVFCDFLSAPVIYEVRGLPDKPDSRNMDTYSATTAGGVTIRNRWSGRGPNDGVIIQCEGGYLDLGAQAAIDNTGKKLRTFSNDGASDPQSHFIQAVRSRKQGDLKTDIEQGHLSACLSHLGNISHRIGKTTHPEAVREALQRDRDGLEAFQRFSDHLAAHDIDLNKTQAVLGPWVTLDSETEQFTGPLADEANALVKRQYREPFVIREQV
jgi:hypothetical protein